MKNGDFKLNTINVITIIGTICIIMFIEFSILNKESIHISRKELIELILSGVSTAGTIATLYIAMLAYKNWHKPNRYIELVKERKELLFNIRESARLQGTTLNEIRMPIIKTIKTIEEDAEINKKSLSHLDLTLTKETLQDLLKEIEKIRESLVKCSRNQELIFHKTDETLKEHLNNFLKSSTITFVVLKSTCKEAILVIENEINYDKKMQSEKLREGLGYINKNISTVYNQEIEIKNSIEKELENFIE